MTKQPLIAVDVDLTIVDTLTPWMEWFKNKTGIDCHPTMTMQFDLVPAMREICIENGLQFFDPFDYWRKDDLYDYMTPIHQASLSKIGAFFH